MADIILGIGTTHGPLLATPPDAWDGRAEVDRKNPALAWRDGTYSFEELYEVRKDKYFDEQNSLAVRTENLNAARRRWTVCAIPPSPSPT